MKKPKNHRTYNAGAADERHAWMAHLAVLHHQRDGAYAETKHKRAVLMGQQELLASLIKWGNERPYRAQVRKGGIGKPVVPARTVKRKAYYTLHKSMQQSVNAAAKEFEVKAWPVPPK